ncbi:hypothetical protein BGX33_012511 [Mortierella sp. NVP41]|nr:hypothetical protein BGX33_012511 [Mortierella sp. NVP41]
MATIPSGGRGVSALPSPLLSAASSASADTRYEDITSPFSSARGRRPFNQSSGTSIDTRYEDVTPPPSTRSSVLSDDSTSASTPWPSSSLWSHTDNEPSVRSEEIDDFSAESTENPSYRYTNLPPIPPQPNHSTQYSESPPPPPSSSTVIATIAAADKTTKSVVTSRHFIQRMQSTVLFCEQSIREGQIMQATILKQEAESIKQDMAVHFAQTQSEVAKNTALQAQMIEMQKATANLLQTYELHEYPIPRLFIILPKEDTTRREEIAGLFVKRFRLYFLCECGEHTKSTDGSESRMSHEIHLARHEGYDLDQPNEFFRKYGSYVLALLQMLKYGVAAAGMVVTPLNIFKVGEGLDEVEDSQEGTTRLPEDGLTNTSAATMAEPVIINKLEALEDADLRHLGSFLKCKDEAKVLGNLYRTVTSEGHVKWVCLDHYRETYRTSALLEFRSILETNGGHYDDRYGRVTIRLSSSILAQQFYSILANTWFVQELVISMAWDMSLDDFRILKSVIQRSIIYHLDIDACGLSGSTFDFINRGRRWEPVLQMMGNSKLGSIAVRNMLGFLLRAGKMPATLQIKMLDLSDQFTSAEEYPTLRKLLLASPSLAELSLFVSSIWIRFDLVKQLTGDLKQLSALSLKGQNGSTASVSYRKGTGEVANIELSVCDYESRRILQLPMVTALSFLGGTAQDEDTIRSALKTFRQLKSLQLTCIPRDFLRVLLFVHLIVDKDTPLDQLSLRNATGDVQVTISSYPGTDIDFGQHLISLSDITSFDAFLRTCPQLETLSFLTPSLAGGIEFVRGIAELKGTLRNLTVRQPNGSKADIVFELRTGEIGSVKLRLYDVVSPKMLQLPNVKKVSISLGEKRKLGALVQSIILSYSGLETIKFLDLGVEDRATLRFFQQAVQDFSNWDQGSSPPSDQPRDESQEVQVRRAGSSSLVDLPQEFVALGNAFRAVFWISDLPLIISSATGSNVSGDNSIFPVAPAFVLQRHDGRTASIRIDTSTSDDSAIVLHVCDFESAESIAPTSGTSLTIVAKKCLFL